MKKHLAVLAFYLILTPIMTYPMALHMAEAVPGPPWDNYVWLYDIWWFKHTLFEAGISPLFNPQIFYPFGYDVGLSETILASKALGLPFILAGGEVVAFNLLVMASFVLSGFAMYLWVLRLSHNRLAAVLAGVIYAFAPYRINALAAGWIPLLPTQWLPLAFLYIDKTLDQRRSRPAALAGLYVAISALSSWYYAYMVALILPLYVLARARPWRQYLLDGRLWRAALVFLVVLGVLAVPVAIPALGLGSSSLSWSLGYADRWSASLEDFVLPNIYHPLWGRFFLGLRPEISEYPWYAPGFIYLGIVPLILAVVGFFAGRRRWRLRRAPSAPLDDRHESLPATVPVARGPAMWTDHTRAALALIAIVAGILALGTTLHIAGQRIYVPAPDEIAHGFARVMNFISSKLALHKTAYSELTSGSGIPVLLPGFLTYLFLPLFSAMRHWYRFGVITTLAVSALAGIGAAYVLGRLQRSGRSVRGIAMSTVAGIALIALILVDFMSAPLPFGLSYTNVVQPVDAWLAEQPGDSAVMQFPLVRALNGPMLYRGIAHGKNMAYGHGTFYPPEYTKAEEILGQFPNDASLDLLKQWGVRYILVGSRCL